MSDTALQRTPLHALHLELGAKMVPFAGYDDAGELPRRHPRRAPPLPRVRRRCSTCRTWARCAWSATTLPPRWNRWCRSTWSASSVGKQRYGFFTNSAGGILDDLMITRRETTCC